MRRHLRSSIQDRAARTGFIAAVLALPLAMGGCKSVGLSDITASVSRPAETMPQTQDGLRSYAEAWGKRYEANPDDRQASMNYARALRQLTQYAQAVAVLERTAMKAPNDMELLGAYGKALADAGRLGEASEVLKRAHTPERPNWSILSAQGSVADQMGDHASAQELYRAALKIAPNEPSVLSNLGLSYALSKQLPDAETTLRQAAADPRADGRVRQNLSLVLALEGKFKEAEETGQKDLSPAQASANVTAIRRMIAQSNTWRDLQKIDGAPVAQAGGTSKVARAPQPQRPVAAAPSRTTAAQVEPDEGFTN